MQITGPLAQALLEATSEPIYVVDRERRITYWNRAAEELTGYKADDVLGRRCRDGILNHVDEHGQLMCGSRCPLLATMADGQPRQASLYLHHQKGHRLPVAVRSGALRDTSGAIIGAVEAFHDDSTCRTLADQFTEVERQALTDPLTNLPNRRMLQRALHRFENDFRRYGHAYAILFVDIDHFKAVNDTHGHDVGDEVLRTVAATLKACGRATDTVGRWGGEEFLILAPIKRPDDAIAIAERTRRIVATARTEVNDQNVRVTLSIGVAVAQADESTRRVIERADVAMLDAKTRGRNQARVSDAPAPLLLT